MKIKLKTFAEDTSNLGKHFRFAVIDLDKSRDYPANFVCILPTLVSNYGKSQTVFFKIFGNKSLEQAKLLLIEALKNESEREVRVEIERRLMLLAPEKYRQSKCGGCGRVFHPRRIRRLKNYLCEDCFKRKYGHQTFPG
jgi:hypothetical protein